ncbi:hypothetical protein HanIR_Chr09g0392181 [Helianthus annuus]|nr:hypothetical protein HanIR_Chr09g0392181 [Helianthus annuus]
MHPYNRHFDPNNPYTFQENNPSPAPTRPMVRPFFIHSSMPIEASYASYIGNRVLLTSHTPTIRYLPRLHNRPSTFHNMKTFPKLNHPMMVLPYRNPSKREVIRKKPRRIK